MFSYMDLLVIGLLLLLAALAITYGPAIRKFFS